MSKGRILLAVNGLDLQRWHELLAMDHEVVMEPSSPEDASIHYAVVWKQRPHLLTRLPNLKAIFSVGAGVDHILSDPTVPDVPIIKMVADNLSRHMSEYILWRVMDHHRQGSLYRAQQQRQIWHEPPQSIAQEIHVGIMGFGTLGRMAAATLIAAGFRVNGWSRRRQHMEGVDTWHGEAALVPFLNATDILVVLLPLTPATHGIVDYDLLRHLRRHNALGGAVLINAGRGALQKEADILRALEDGTLKEASLDVFETEPLPQGSGLWQHPRVFITPHAAAASDPRHLVPPMLAQIEAFERGESLRNVVDRLAGY